MARADLVEAGLLENPVFEASASWPLEGSGAAALEFGLVQNFLQALEIPLRRTVAKSRLATVQSEVARNALDLVHRARDAFYELQAAKQEAELLRNVVDARGASTATMQRIRDAGNVPELRVAREEREFERAKISLAQARGRVAQARERLNRLMGLWGEQASRWTIGERLPELPDDPLPGDFQPGRIVDRNLDLTMARQRVATANARAEMARVAPFIPAMHAGGEAERSGAKEWEAGPVAEVTLPVFDTGQTARDRAAVRVRQRKHAAKATAVALRSSVRATRERVERFHAIARRYKTQLLPLADEILTRTRRQYNAMGVGVFDLIDARTEQVDTARRYIAALRAYWHARNDLRTLTAGKLVGDEGSATPRISAGETGGDEEGGH